LLLVIVLIANELGNRLKIKRRLRKRERERERERERGINCKPDNEKRTI
jgi:hypothetical protein